MSGIIVGIHGSSHSQLALEWAMRADMACMRRMRRMSSLPASRARQTKAASAAGMRNFMKSAPSRRWYRPLAGEARPESARAARDSRGAPFLYEGDNLRRGRVGPEAAARRGL